MNLKVGDKVRIKDNIRECTFGYCPPMLNYKGKIGTIASIDKDEIRLEADSWKWSWSENVLELIDDVKMKRIDYILNAKDNIQAILDETELNCSVCPGYCKDRKDCDGDCEFYYKKYLNEEIKVDKLKLKLVEENIEAETVECDKKVVNELSEEKKQVEDDVINPFIEEYEKIVNETVKLCKRKNADYGSSVQDTYEKFGDISYLVRITDKYNRICALLQNGKAEVRDESITDTIVDLANYCFLWASSRNLKVEGDVACQEK